MVSAKSMSPRSGAVQIPTWMGWASALTLGAVAGGYLLTRPTSSTATQGPKNNWVAPEPLGEMILPMQVPHQPFASTDPGVIVFLPPGFRPDLPLDIVVYFRGFGSCISVIAGDTPGPCHPGGARHGASQLISQFRVARKNALLIVPELRVEAATTDTGTFGQPGGFTSFIDEVLTRVAIALGPQQAISFPRTVHTLSLYCHSGGWHVTAEVVRRSGMSIREIVLLDAFYGDQSVYQEFAMHVAQESLATNTLAGRFGSVHTGGNPSDHSLSLARAVQAQYPQAVSIQPTDGTPTSEELQHPVIIKASVLDHSTVPSFYFGRFVASSTLNNTL